MKEELRKFEETIIVEDLAVWNEDLDFEFPCRAGHLLKAFSCEGLSVLEDRQ